MTSSSQSDAPDELDHLETEIIDCTEGGGFGWRMKGVYQGHGLTVKTLRVYPITWTCVLASLSSTLERQTYCSMLLKGG